MIPLLRSRERFSYIPFGKSEKWPMLVACVANSLARRRFMGAPSRPNGNDLVQSGVFVVTIQPDLSRSRRGL